MLLRYIFVICIIATIRKVQASRILALMPFPGKSHYINIQPIMQKLAERGHDITVITTFYEKDPLPNYHQIIVDKKTMWDAGGTKYDKFNLENMPYWKEMLFLWDSVHFTTEVAFNSSSVQDFIRNDKSHFDLVIIELFFQEALYMFAHKYKAPVVAISTMGFTQYLGDSMGSPLKLSYMPHEFLRTRGKLNVWKRLENLYYTFYDLLGRYYYMLPKQEKLLENHFMDLPRPLPRLHELERNVSVVLVNTHYSIDTVRPKIPGIVEIGGVHIKPEQNLPDEILEFINESPNGVIFFSLGSNLNSRDMPKEKVNMFLTAFGKLRQRVLWKWEDEELPGRPENVMIKAWLPQNDILAHHNVRLFITHGGLLSFTEAVHFGKPIIGIPVYGDQHLNTARAADLGFGIKLEFSKLTEEKISKTLHEILHNPMYSNKAKELANRFRDRPMSPLDTAIYWIEYVIRHKGATFMRSPALSLMWYEVDLFDIMSIIALIFSLTLFLCLYLCKIKLKPKEKIKQESSKKSDKRKKM